MYVIVHRIYEGNTNKLVLEHRFYGETLEKADRLYHAHLRFDAFLRTCEECHQFGEIKCNTSMNVEIT